MHAWIRSTLILAVALTGLSSAVLAEPMSVAPFFVEPAPVDLTPVYPGRVVTPTPTPLGEADQPASGAAMQSVMPGEVGVIEDKEAAAGPLPVEALPVGAQSEVEVKAPSGPKSSTDKIAEKFMALDVDASDGVSMDEYITIVQQRVMARFAAMDIDANGEVTEDEYRIFWKTRMAKWYRLKR